MIIKLEESYYNLAKTIDFTDLGKSIRFDDATSSIEVDDVLIEIENYFGEKRKKKAIDVLLGCIEDEVVSTGITNDENTVLPRGKALYELYDGIYYNL